jgi:hypothetical protein
MTIMMIVITRLETCAVWKLLSSQCCNNVLQERRHVMRFRLPSFQEKLDRHGQKHEVLFAHATAYRKPYNYINIRLHTEQAL